LNEGNGKEGRARYDPYEAFRVSAFRRYTAGALLVHIGAAAQGLAIGWEVYVRTGKPAALGLVGLVQAVPMLLLTLPAGYLADVFDRRRVMIAGMLGTSATSLALAAFSHWRGSIALMYVLLFFDAAFHRVASPAGQALLPTLVPRRAFENAIKWRTSLFQVSSMAGPALGGFIIGWSVPAAYLFSAGTTVLFIVILLSIEVPVSERTPRGQMLRRLREGAAFVWRRRTLLGAISLDMFAVLLGGAVYLLPIFARDIVRGAPAGMAPEQVLGWLRAAPAAGSLVMALLLAHMPPMRRAGRAMLWSVAGFGLATVVFGLSHNFWLSLGMLCLTGAFDNVSVVVRHTLVQLGTPNEMRGRVSAINSVFIGSSNELGGFESGMVAQLWGPVVSVVSGGLGTLAVVGLWSRLFPSLRRFGALDGPEEADGTLAGTGPSG
jgi:MFS family permease